MTVLSSETKILTRVRVTNLKPTEDWGISEVYLNSREVGAVGKVTGFMQGQQSALRVTHDNGKVAAYQYEELEEFERI